MRKVEFYILSFFVLSILAVMSYVVIDQNKTIQQQRKIIQNSVPCIGAKGGTNG